MDRKELTRDEVYKLVKNRKSYVIFRSLETALNMLSKDRKKGIDGKNVHSFANLSASVHSTLITYKKGHFPIGETMTEYEQRDKVLFEQGIHYILIAMNDYGIKP